MKDDGHMSTRNLRDHEPDHEHRHGDGGDGGGGGTVIADEVTWRLHAAGLAVTDRLGAGMDGTVYALDAETVVKVWSRQTAPSLERLRAFYAELSAAGLPFATPLIHDLRSVEGTPVTIERRLHGRPLSEFIGAAGPTERALRAFAGVVDVLRQIEAGHAARDLTVMDEPNAFYTESTASWPRALLGLLERRVEAYADRLRPAVPGFDVLLDQTVAGIRALPHTGGRVVRGDLCPPNVLVDEELRVVSVLDWGYLSTAGDSALDASLAAGFFDMYGPRARAIDETLTRWFVTELGYAAPLLHLYRAVYAIIGACAYDPAGADGHFEWCAAQLRRDDLRAALGG
jgi:aminoglycoside phosphotransferase (APT) family kinase protein